ncbi:hypothetical protein [Clostridium manihotivorum]|uniref:ABC-2 family transporter protein n=1 Tax=Clostridium manihotivorum TaxID=2320868 RepID=A0A410DTZ5_9CLOT|nr:hypothetical protein [Clostridium manihotivorum]QAA32555.1 hypothetical protein C1I91_13435 [Clostridium manihotivorum]
MEVLKSSLSFVKYNIKVSLNLNVAVALVFVLFLPFIFSFKLIDAFSMAKISELFISITGIILFPYLSSLDEVDNIGEVTSTKRIPYIYAFSTRLIFVVLFNLLLIIFATTIAKIQGADFPQLKFTFSILVTCLTLGLIGLTAALLTHSIAAGYLLPFSYYAFEFSTKGQYTKNFYLFSLLKNSYTEKFHLLALLLILICINIMLILRKS